MYTIKSILLLLACMFMSGVFAQKAPVMKVSGELEGLTSAYVYITSAGGGRKSGDSLKVTNGKFSGTVKVAAIPQQRRFFFNNMGILVWAEPGAHVKISGSAKDFGSVVIQGGQTEKDARLLAAQIDSASRAVGAKAAAQRKASGDTSRAASGKVMDEMREARKLTSIQFIRAHPNSHYSLVLLSEMDDSYDQVMMLYNQLGTNLRKSEAGEQFLNKLNAKKVFMDRRSEGQYLLAFSRPDVNGDSVSSAVFKGKYVFVDFWASWCGPCRAENPNVLAAYNQYKDKNFTVVGISIDDDKEKWKQAIREDNLPWMQLLDRKDKKSAIMDYYGLNSIPSSFLVDPSGKIIARNLRGTALEEKLKEVLGK